MRYFMCQKESCEVPCYVAWQSPEDPHPGLCGDFAEFKEVDKEKFVECLIEADYGEVNEV